MVDTRTGNIFCVLITMLTVTTGTVSARNEDLEQRLRALEEKVTFMEKTLGIVPPGVSVEATTPVETLPEQASAPAASPHRTVETSRIDPLSNVLKSRILEKEARATGEGRGVSLLIAYTNIGRKDIVSFKGTILLEDRSGVLLTGYFIEMELSIPSLESKSGFSTVPVIQEYMAGYKRLFDMNPEDIKVTLNLVEITFSDGMVRAKE